MSDYVALEDAFEEPKEQRRVLRLAEQGHLKMLLRELVALPIPEDAEAAWADVERELGFEPDTNAPSAFASSLPVPDDHPLTWLLVPPEKCGELAAKGEAEVRHLPLAEDPKQLAVFHVPRTIRLPDLWVNPAQEPIFRTPQAAYATHETRRKTKRAQAWKQLRQLAMQSKGDEQVELPGHGRIYLKLDRRNQGIVRWKETSFSGPDDGEPISSRAFEGAWQRAGKAHNLHPTHTQPTHSL